MNFIRKHKRGISLIEVVVGVCLLTIVWLAAVNIIVVSRGSGSLARHKTQAIYVMQETIEKLRKQTFGSIAGSTTTVSIDTRGTPDSTADDFMGTQTVTVTTTDPYYKEVLVGITWNESFFGKQKQVKEYCGTYIANDPQIN
jgi:Tfp pilus assembly protein PilV